MPKLRPASGGVKSPPQRSVGGSTGSAECNLMSNSPAYFRLIQLPCCGQMLCWVNPRLPNYCPECGKYVFAEVKSCVLMSDPYAWVSYSSRGVKEHNVQTSPSTTVT